MRRILASRISYPSQSPLEFTIRSLPLRNDPRNVCHVQIAHPGSVVSPDHLGIGVAWHPRYLLDPLALAKPSHRSGVPKLLFVGWFLSTVR
jgi:hypothetical protein